MMTRRQYIGITLLTSVIIAVLGLPALLRQPGITAGHVLGQSGRVMLFTGSLMALNYWLRFSHTVFQRWLRRQPPLFHRALRIGANLLVACLLGPLLTWYVGPWDQDRPLGFLLVSSVLFALVILVVQLFIEVSDRSSRLLRENEQLRHEQLQARYEGLKQQLSPHFLFNSLATLRWLVHEDAAAAERFVEEMSGVYRYLLQYGERDAVPLREELAFLRSYVYLLEMRFAGALRLEIELPEPLLGRLVPPLALQTLVENAVKHNAVSRKYPLHIWVEAGPDDCLLVRNSRRPRLTPEPSSGVGLRNLAARLRILHGTELLIEDTAEEFSVCLQLSQAEHSSQPSPTPQTAVA